MRELGDPDRLEPAMHALDRLLDDQDSVAALRSAKDAVAAAVERARREVAPHLEAWFEARVARYLVALDQHELARAGLERFTALAPSADAAGDEVLWARADGLLLLAELQRRSGDYDLARATAQRAQRTADPTTLANAELAPQFERLLANALGVEARTLLDLGLVGASYEPMARQRELARGLVAHGFHDAVLRAALQEGEYYAVQDRFARALAALDRCTIPSRELDVVRIVVRLGLADLERRDDPDGERQLRERIADPRLEAGFVEGARLVLLRCAIERGDGATARAELDALRCSVGGDPRRPLAAELAMLTTRLLLREADADDSALREQLERHRAAFDQLLAEWQATTVRRGGIGFLDRASRRRMLTELVRLTRRLDGDAAADRCAADGLVRMQQMTSTARQLEARPATVAEVRAVFAPPGHGVLCLIAEPVGSLLVAIDHERERTFELPGSRELARTVDALQQALTATASATGPAERAAGGERLRACARAAATALLPEPVRALFQGWHTVTVADHGMLDGLPWECLLLDEERLLGERLGVNTLTSLPLGVALDRARPAPVPADRARLRLVATLLGARHLIDARAGSASAVDPDTVAALGRPFAGCDALLDAGATPQAVLGLRCRGPITLILAHGALRDPEQPPGLALAPESGDDGWFGADAAERVPVRGLVLVSACGAGRTHRRLGDEALHGTLGGAFVLAGAHTVVQTAADLHLRAHARLLERALAALAEGAATAAAFRRARAELATRADWIERFEHAQVQVFGLGHRAVLAR